MLWPSEAAPWLFVLDELTFVKGWAKVVAHLREHDRAFRLATVILTGSSAVDLVESADILHGRRGRSDRPLDRLHMPMTFRDYVGARAPATVPSAHLQLADLLSPTGRDAVREAALRTDELDQYLIEYARSGGLPVPVTDMLADRVLALGTVTELWRGLSADVRRLNRNEATLSKLLARTVVGLGSLTNFADLMRDMDVTKTTASAYVDLLAKSFALVVLHQRDTKRQGGPSLTKGRKHYFEPRPRRVQPHAGSRAALLEQLPEPVSQTHARRPSQLSNPVAHQLGLGDVTWPAIAVRDLQRPTRELLQQPYQLEHARGHTRRDVPRSTLVVVAQEQKCRDEIRDVEEVPALRAVAMDDQR